MVSPATAARLEREGQERALTYRLALATGLRRGELSRVRVEHLHKDRLLVPGELLKVKVDDAVTFLLPPGLAADLGRPRPAGPLVDISEAANWVRMHQRLLAHAGVPYTNRKGHVRSFHSLRKSARVWLERASCTYTDQKRYLRHAGRDVTERNYSTLGDGRPVNGGRVFRLLCALDGYLSGGLAELPAAKRPAGRRAG